jgi:hypothetical protein
VIRRVLEFWLAATIHVQQDAHREIVWSFLSTCGGIETALTTGAIDTLRVPYQLFLHYAGRVFNRRSENMQPPLSPDPSLRLHSDGIHNMEWTVRLRKGSSMRVDDKSVVTYRGGHSLYNRRPGPLTTTSRGA